MLIPPHPDIREGRRRSASSRPGALVRRRFGYAIVRMNMNMSKAEGQVNFAKLDPTTEEDIRRQMIEDDEDAVALLLIFAVRGVASPTCSPLRRRSSGSNCCAGLLARMVDGRCGMSTLSCENGDKLMESIRPKSGAA